MTSVDKWAVPHGLDCVPNSLPQRQLGWWQRPAAGVFVYPLRLTARNARPLTLMARTQLCDYEHYRLQKEWPWNYCHYELSSRCMVVYLYRTSIPHHVDFRSALETTPPQEKSNTSAPNEVEEGEHSICFESIVVSLFFSAKRSFSVAS